MRDCPGRRRRGARSRGRRILSEIQRLFPGIELYSAGEPSAHTLFVLGKGLAPPLGTGDELLLIDPPADSSAFVLPARTAVILTQPEGGAPVPPGAARVQTQPGGVAHIRVGDHLLDLYSFAGVTLVHLPALRLLCSGPLGSGLSGVAGGVAGGAEGALEALRLAARLVREDRVQLLIPALGTPAIGRVEAMARLAEDVNRLHVQSVTRAPTRPPDDPRLN